ncbi:DUF6351 family protein [Pseudorhodoferax sp.]|uniref:DUF6351 family protein n=1 Tax=Pseudorhodoferax sp. TaxID=1993553 RepID=UPI002DD65144|nr:DUF6351 family protein [Pseudorhodoferax sp.]
MQTTAAPFTALATIACGLLVAGCGGGGDNPPSGSLSVVSPRADAVTGGDALVQLQGVDDVSTLAVRVNGTKADTQIRRDAAGRALLRVAGLKTGDNTVEVVSAGGASVARLQLNNHPSSGPLFSGPHQQPWVCETASFVLPDGSRLPASTNADCSVPTVVHYAYVDTGGALKALADAKATPADVAKTTSTNGASVNFVIRIETGTLNRGIYQTAILHDPATDTEAVGPFNRPRGWNGELVFPFGGACNPGYRQATSLGGDYKTKLYELSKGYAVASSTLNVWGNNCNSVLSAESALMVKERFVETYGPPSATIGQGPSGGAKSQLMIVDNYPGILDGILPGIQAGGPDGVTANPSTVDCSLLVNYFNAKTAQAWGYDEKTAVAGWSGWNNCETQPTDSAGALPWHGVFSPFYMVPTSRTPPDRTGCNAALPVAQLYHPVTNPTGARCDLYSNQINLFGPTPERANVPRRPMDNVGIQYGLAAFNAGSIDAEKFVELNEKIGGYDVDGNYVAARTVADTTALRIAYQTGQVLNGGGGLKSAPVIDLRMYYEKTPDLHDRLGTFITRERLRAVNGDADNMVMLTYPPGLPPGPFASNVVANEALGQMSAWLARVQGDTSGDTAAVKVRRHKPADLADACWDAAGRKITEPAVYTGQTQCNALYPAHRNPRLVAGMPLKHDVLKCQLKPVAASDYARPLDAAQLARLQAAFPQGVCDFGKPGVEQQGLAGTWFAFATRGVPTPFGR